MQVLNKLFINTKCFSTSKCVSVIGVILLCQFFAFEIQAQTSVSREYQVKAAFLYNFTQFVEWPSTAFSGPADTLVIGILGEDPFGNYLDDTLAGEKKLNHPIIVKRFSDVKDINSCHLLFLNLPGMHKEVLDSLKNRSILTVSDENDFLENGGMIRFYTQNNKIRLQINPSAAKNSNLVISSKLLRLAEIYD